ncbi:2-hydroxyacyl-CoA dehydratase subunit D [Thermodesulfobacteriota bacterium]
MGVPGSDLIGFACAYTPLALIHAAGFTPCRVLPTGDHPDQAGRLLHDNLCPHVKRILDRALQGDLPELAAMVFVNSCDAMRRLADAWKRVRPGDRTMLIDLPVTAEPVAIDFFAGELTRFAGTLETWGGRKLERSALEESIGRYNRLAELFDTLRECLRRGILEGGSAKMQEAYNRASTESLEDTLEFLESLATGPKGDEASNRGVPVFVFGNVLPDPEVFALFESWGARVVGDDLCTGSRLFAPLEIEGPGEIMSRLARALLARPACARTIDPAGPGAMAEAVISGAEACGARGIIGHTVKFCDPYLARLPSMQVALRDAGWPILVLEGDCTMRSIGQQRTRVEAFVEMLR